MLMLKHLNTTDVVHSWYDFPSALYTVYTKPLYLRIAIQFYQLPLCQISGV